MPFFFSFFSFFFFLNSIVTTGEFSLYKVQERMSFFKIFGENVIWELPKCSGHFLGPIHMSHFITLVIRVEVIGEVSLKLSAMIFTVVFSQDNENMKYHNEYMK